MRCKFCREELPEGANFCPVCGTPVEPAKEGDQEKDKEADPYQYGRSDQEDNPYHYDSPEQGWDSGQYTPPYQYGAPDQEPRGQYQYGAPDQGNYQYGPSEQWNPNQGQYQNSGGAPNSGTPYMILAIFTVLMCCMPLGIVSIIYASRINGLLRTGDYAGARDAAGKVKLFSIIGIIGGLVSMLLFFAFGLTDFVNDISNEISLAPPIMSETREVDEDDTRDWEDEEEEDDEDKKPAAAAPAAPSSELGETWDSYTVQINDKVLTLPCTYEELRAAGLTLDTEETPEDYIVNANEYVTAFFEDENDNYIMADLVNGTDKAKTVKECLIGGISVSDYGVSEGGITIIFPGGLKIGSTREEMLEKYGNTDDVYEGDSLCIYTWYEEDNYYSSCEMDLDTETGLINSMNIQNHGE